ncbi:MAG: hypothetical protein ACFFGZ_15085 [Candidatus Thorarchaeota archaeon]
MNDKLRVNLVWEDDDFKPLGPNKSLPDDEVSLTIDEESEKIILRITEGTGLVVRRTIQRRVQSIAKSGFLVSGGLRIGAGFPMVEEAPEEQLSDTLLQAGHGYIADAEMAAMRAAEQQSLVEAPKQSKAPESQVVEPISPTPVPMAPATTPQESVVTPSFSAVDQNLVAVGIFAGSLLESVSELFVSKDAEDRFSLDFGSGNVIRFKIQNGAVSDLSTLGISQEDAAIQRALNAIKTYMK